MRQGPSFFVSVGVRGSVENMTKRAENIRALLSRSADDLHQVRKDYDASLQAQAISSELKIDIKNLCENLRSVLDYLAHDMRETHCPVAGKKNFYFPIFDTAPSFAGQMSAWYPGLDTANAPLYAYLSGLQPYQGADRLWLSQFNKLNNLNKHGDLVEQTRVTFEQVKVSSTSGAQVTWNPANVRFGSGVRIAGVPVDPRTQMPIRDGSLTVQKTIWVDFKFHEPDVSVLPLLSEATAGIAKIAAEVQALL